MNTSRPNLSGVFTNNRPKLSEINKIMSKHQQINQKNQLNDKMSSYKLGDFICISLILAIICYFIFFGRRSKKEKNNDQTKEKLEQIKNLNYNYFKS